MASVGLDCDRLQPIPVWRDEAHHEASMGSASKPELGYPRGASVRFEKEKPPDYATVRGLQVMRVCCVFARPDWGSGGLEASSDWFYATRDTWENGHSKA